jgi:hypothetical protein
MRILGVRAAITGLTVIGMLSGCADVKVYSPTDSPGERTGTITPLGNLLGQDSDPLTLVFVHGVGDHCRGYAVGDEKNQSTPSETWLDSTALQRLWLTAVPHSQKDSEITAAELGIGGQDDGLTAVTLIRERDYLWAAPSRAMPLKVHAVEVTWSPLTRWIKNSLLGYDGTQITPRFPFLHGGDGVDTCQDPRDTIGQETPTTGQWFSAPDRVWANANLKWGVLDRELADALIYAGTYGVAMQRALGAALCRAFGGHENNAAPCTWPTTDQVPEGHFVFVTHSLGSRMLYDTLADLSAVGHARVHTTAFTPSDVQRASAAVETVIDRTAGFYMMANQLPMFGAASLPLNASINVPQPHALTVGSSTRRPETRQLESASADPLAGLLRLRARRAGPREQRPTLSIVSFNDTNDLLTWHLPAWYADTVRNQGYGVEIADVFVRNSVRWLLLLESPSSAHDGYFQNMGVWEAMFCGAKDGKLTHCLQ